MTVEVAGLRAQLRVLLHDRYAQSCIAAIVVLAALWLSPFVDASHPAPPAALNALFAAGSAAACLVGLRQVTDRHERGFWRLCGISLSLWATVEVVYAVVPPSSWNTAWDVVADALFLLYYVPLLVAVDRFAAPRQRAHSSRLAQWIRPVHLGITTVAWVTYAIVVPLLTVGAGTTEDWYAYVVLDVVVVGASIGAGRPNRPRRWNILQRWLILAFSMAALFDTLDGFVVVHGTQLHPLGLFLWAIPHVCLIATARLRRYLPPGPADATGVAPPGRVEAASDTTLIVLTALSLPVTHMFAVIAGAAPVDVQAPQGLVVALSMLVVGIVAAAEYHEMEVERTALAQERARLEQSILQIQKMEAIGRLGGGIAHDYNNLLTAIGGYADIVLESLPDDDPTAYAMKQVRASVDRASALTRQLLIVGRRQILSFEAVDINETIRDIPYAHRHLLGERTDLRLAPAPGVDCAWVDPAQLEQVLLNLVVNARDAMPDGGIVRVSTSNVVLGDGAASGWPESRAGRYVRIEVADEGVGIPDDVLSQIFEPFFTTKPAGSGTGLGLAVAYGIVRQSGGRLSLVHRGGQGDDVRGGSPRRRHPGAGETRRRKRTQRHRVGDHSRGGR